MIVTGDSSLPASSTFNADGGVIASPPTTIQIEIQSLSPTAVIELFILDSSNLAGGALMHFHAGTNGLHLPIVWDGIVYVPLPIEASGFDKLTSGTLPRPKVRIANIDGLLSAAVQQSDDLIGATLTRKRTFQKFLDAENFPGGINPDANTNQSFSDDIWFVDRKVSENRYVIEWELASAFDLQGVLLPYRQVIQNSCWWKYRTGVECGYAGAPYDLNDLPCLPAQDRCSKRLSSCRVRFGDAILPFGGFPGAVRHG